MADGDIGEIITEDGVSLKAIRRELHLSQAHLAQLLGFSVRAIQSCEQGWRRPGASLERGALLLLMASRNNQEIPNQRCWEITQCPPERREQCISYRTGQGHLCWFLNGTLCSNEKLPDWESKRPLCTKCRVFEMLLNPSEA